MTYLALDTASRTVSVALGEPGHVEVREMPQSSSSRELLPAIQELLTVSGVELAALSGLVAVRGPGSFTGLRIGLATVLGIHQALGLRATAVGTLDLLAWAARRASPPGELWGAVWALRDQWYLQRLCAAGGAPPEPPPEVVRWTRERWLREVEASPVLSVVGLAVEELVGPLVEAPAEDRVTILEPGPLAAVAVEMAPTLEQWDAGLLTHPLYVQGPSVTLPSPQGGAGR